MGEKKTAIMGFGNPVRSDDGIAMYVIEQLQKILPQDGSFGVFDMGTSAFEVLFKLKGYTRILVVDAVINTGEVAGTLYKVPAKEMEAQIQDDPMVFLHSLKWDQALSYARKILGADYPEDIQVYLVAVDNTRLEIGLSEPVQNAGDRLVKIILEDLGIPHPIQ